MVPAEDHVGFGIREPLVSRRHRTPNRLKYAVDIKESSGRPWVSAAVVAMPERQSRATDPAFAGGVEWVEVPHVLGQLGPR
jgi:hypothetical protein